MDNDSKPIRRFDHRLLEQTQCNLDFWVQALKRCHRGRQVPESERCVDFQLANEATASLMQVANRISNCSTSSVPRRVTVRPVPTPESLQN
jgi:hypothetical protein